MAGERQAILNAELATDPGTRGYGTMSDQDAFTDLGAVRIDNWAQRTGGEIIEAVHAPEFVALGTAQREAVAMVVSAGELIETAPGANARAIFVNAFGGTSTTIANLANVANQQISRAEQLGLGGWLTVGRVNANR